MKANKSTKSKSSTSDKLMARCLKCGRLCLAELTVENNTLTIKTTCDCCEAPEFTNINDYLDVVKGKKAIIIICKVCKKMEPATEYCKKCVEDRRQFICDHCSIEHRFIKSGHKSIPIDQYKSSVDTKCSIHGKKFFKYCKSCSFDFCDKCPLKDHKFHSCVTLSNMSEQVKVNKIRDKLNQLGSLKENLEKCINYFSKYLPDQKSIDNMNSLYQKFNEQNEIIQEFMNIIVDSYDPNWPEFFNISNIYQAIIGFQYYYFAGDAPDDLVIYFNTLAYIQNKPGLSSLTPKTHFGEMNIFFSIYDPKVNNGQVKLFGDHAKYLDKKYVMQYIDGKEKELTKDILFSKGQHKVKFAVKESIDTFSELFNHCSALVGFDFATYNTSKIVNMSKMFSGCTSLSNIVFSKFKTENVTDMSYMFSGCTGLTKLGLQVFNTGSVTNMNYMFNECIELVALPLDNFDTKNVTTFVGMFNACVKLTALNLSSFNTSNATDMNMMFKNCVKLTSINLQSFNTVNVTNMSYMFSGCGFKKLDITRLNTSNVVNMKSMFEECTAMNNVDFTNLDTGKVTTMNSMFLHCRALKELSLKFNTQNVKDMSSMFANCSNLQAIDLSSFNTGLVETMSKMFEDCGKLTYISLKSFNTKNLTDMSFMFHKCASLGSTDLSSFNTSNVVDMSNLYRGCVNLSQVYFKNFDTSNCRNMNHLVSKCLLLTDIDLSSFKTENVTNMAGMFKHCKGIKSINLSNFNTSNVRTLKRFMKGCELLTEIDLSSFDLENVMDMTGMFSDCIALLEIKMGGPINMNANVHACFAGLPPKGRFYFDPKFDMEHLTQQLLKSWGVNKKEKTKEKEKGK